MPLGVKAATNATGAAAMALELGVDVRRRRAARCAASVASPAASSTGASATASTFVDDYAHLPGEVAAAIATAREAVAGACHRRVPTAPLHAHRIAVGATSPMCSSAPTRSFITDVYAAGETPIAGVQRPPRRAGGRRPASRRSPSRTCRGSADLPTLPAAFARPRRRRPDAGRGRPHDDARRLAGRGRRDARRRDRIDALDAAPAGPRGSATRPSAALTTYRCGGPLAGARARRRRGRAAASSPMCSARPGAGVLVVGRGSNLLVADAGFAGVALVARPASSSSSTSTTAPRTSCAGGAVALPVLARRAAAAGLGGLEFFVGIPGSVGGAVRMNAGGHGARHRGRPRHARVCSTRRRRGPRGRDRPTSASATGVRRSGRVPSSSVRRSPGTRPTPPRVRRAHRRDRALAPGAPARRPERGLGVHQPTGRRRRAPHRSGGLQGPAHRRRRGLGEARELLRRRARRVGRRCLRARRARCSGVVAAAIRACTSSPSSTSSASGAEDHADDRCTIDPRIRERRIEVQREAGRKRLRITLLVAVAMS